MAVLVLDDRSGRIETTLFSEELTRFRDQLVDDMIVVCEGTVSHDERDGTLKMRANAIASLADARRDRARGVLLRLESSDFSGEFSGRLKQLLAGDAGEGCPLLIEYTGRGASGRVALGEPWRVDPNDDCLARLKQQFGASRVSVVYATEPHEHRPRRLDGAAIA
jgi:DNA polymerase-3 subunit alpha